MADDVRVYGTDDIRMLLGTLFLLVALPIFMYFVGLSEVKIGITAVRFWQNSVALLGVLLVILGWISWFRKIPRLEVSSRSVKYVTFGYSLEAAWEDIEQIKMFTKTWRNMRFPFEEREDKIGRGLVARQYKYKLSKWGRLLPSYDNWDHQGIQIEPHFVPNIYIGDLYLEIKRYAPVLLENNPYLV